MISNFPLLTVEAKRTPHCIRIRQEVFDAFEVMCRNEGYLRISDVVETMMLSCLRNSGLFYLLTHDREFQQSVKKRRSRQALQTAKLRRDVEKLRQRRAGSQ